MRIFEKLYYWSLYRCLDMKILFLLLCITLCSCSNDAGDKLEYYPHFNQTKTGVVALDSLLRINNRRCSAEYDVMIVKGAAFLRKNENSGSFKLVSFCLPSNEADVDSIESVMNRNYLTSAVNYHGVYLFNDCYYNKNYDYDYTRYLTIDRKGVVEIIRNDYRILDIKNGVILLAYKYKRR